jgi:DNA-binding NtrC family response regulator
MSHGKGTILLVDDEEQVRGVLVETLKAAGYLVFDAGNYYEALKVLDALPKGSVDLLVTDVSLPGPNGCELALRFLDREPKGRVLFISGYTGAEVCHQYDVKLSDKEFLAKPLYPKPFIERVEAILEQGDASLPEWVSRRLQRFSGEAASHRG